MKRVITSRRTPVKLENIVGTKWIGWSGSVGNRVTVEFMDNNSCIYTTEPKKYPITYSVNNGSLFISSIEGPFELWGDVLYNNNLPAFSRTS